MVVTAGSQNPSHVEATAYLGAVAAFAAVLFVILLFLNRKWCYSFVFGANCCEDNIKIRTAVPHEKAHYGIDRVFSFEASSDSDDEARLQIKQDKSDIESGFDTHCVCIPGPVNLVESAIRETCIDAVSTQPTTSTSSYVHALEAQSSIDSVVNNYNDTHQLCSAPDILSVSSSGLLEVALLYDAPVRCMTVHVLQARDLPIRDSKGQTSQSQVRLLLLPMKKQKYKTKIRCGESPQFMESFLFHKINPEDVHGLSLRIRIYGCERMRRQRHMGEALLNFSSLDLEVENSLWIMLLPRSTAQQQVVSGSGGGGGSVSVSVSGVTTVRGSQCDMASLGRSDSASSSCSTRTATPELLLGIAYNATTGHLAVEVVKGSHFRKLSINKVPDTYVKLCLVSSLGMEMARSKTTTRRGQPNPLYKELFIFQVALFQVSEVTLMVSVWWRRSVKKNEMVGWLSLGLNSSGREQAQHWHDVQQHAPDQVQRWHALHRS